MDKINMLYSIIISQNSYLIDNKIIKAREILLKIMKL